MGTRHRDGTLPSPEQSSPLSESRKGVAHEVAAPNSPRFVVCLLVLRVLSCWPGHGGGREGRRAFTRPSACISRKKYPDAQARIKEAVTSTPQRRYPAYQKELDETCRAAAARSYA